MKILLIVPYFAEDNRWMISGQKTAYELAKRHEVVVLTTGRKAGVEKVHPNLTIHRLKDIFLPDPINFSLIPGLQKATARLIDEEKPKICLINKHMFVTALAIWTVRRAGIPVLVQTDTFPGINWFPRRRFVREVMWTYARLIGNRVLRAADRVILLHEGLTDVSKRLGLDYEVIHNGVDVEELDRSEKPTDLVKPKDEVWIGYVGRMESIKGWYDLAKVAQNLVGSHPKVKFLFIGQFDNSRGQVAKYRSEQIQFLGQRSDVLGLYKLLDIFVLPSYSEGLPNALMEAMASSVCSVASDVGGVKHLLEDGESGLVFQPGNRTELQVKLERLLEEPELRQRLGRKARQRILAEYDLRKTTSQLNDLLSRYV